MIPHLRIQTITISQSKYLPPQQVEQVFSPLKGKHYLALFLSKTFFNAVQSDYLFINSIDHQFVFPSSLRIQLHEKEPVYSFVTETASFFVSKEGIILNHYVENVSNDNMSSLVIVKGIPRQVFNSAVVESGIMDQLNEIVRNMTLYFPNQSVQVEFNPPFNLTLYMNDHLEIKLGTMDYLDIKFTHLDQFLAYYKQPISELRYIDLRVEDRIIVGMED